MSQPNLSLYQAQFEAIFTPEADLYTALNAYRDWFNATTANAEIFLEDNWFKDKTTIEYIVRSLETLDFVILAEDVYGNFIAEGTLQLGPYQSTHWVVDAPWETIATFFAQNPAPQPK